MIRDTPYKRELREMVVRAVYGRWHVINKAMTLDDVFLRVEREAKIAHAQGQWSYQVMPIKRTVDRRVNEAADPRFYDGESPPLRMVPPKGSGLYLPNPERFTGEDRRTLEKLLEVSK